MAAMNLDPGLELRRIPPRRAGHRGRIQDILESAGFQHAITGLIVANAIILGLETSRRAMELAGGLLQTLDRLLLSVFVLELLLKLVVYRFSHACAREAEPSQPASAWAAR